MIVSKILIVFGIVMLIVIGVAKVFSIFYDDVEEKDDDQPHDSFPPAAMGGAAA